MDLSIIPECYIDTNLVETLVPPTKGYNHQKGCGTVTSVMKDKFKDSFAVGIIDKDKQQVDYLNEFTLINEFNNTLFLYKHNAKHHYIIQISPALERFLIAGAASANISLADYDLPLEFDRFKKISKSINSKEDPRFKKLIKSIIRAEDRKSVV